MAGREHKNNFKVLDYAYADPGEPIQAGQTSDEPVTGMGSLGLLAAGAAVWLLGANLDSAEPVPPRHSRNRHLTSQGSLEVAWAPSSYSQIIQSSVASCGAQKRAISGR